MNKHFDFETQTLSPQKESMESQYVLIVRR